MEHQSHRSIFWSNQLVSGFPFYVFFLTQIANDPVIIFCHFIFLTPSCTSLSNRIDIFKFRLMMLWFWGLILFACISKFMDPQMLFSAASDEDCQLLQYTRSWESSGSGILFFWGPKRQNIWVDIVKSQISTLPTNLSYIYYNIFIRIKMHCNYCIWRSWIFHLWECNNYLIYTSLDVFWILDFVFCGR